MRVTSKQLDQVLSCTLIKFRALVVTTSHSPPIKAWNPGTDSPESSSIWVDQVPNHANVPGLHVFSYDGNVELREDVWASLLKQGEVFLEDLLGFIEEKKADSIPS